MADIRSGFELLVIMMITEMYRSESFTKGREVNCPVRDGGICLDNTKTKVKVGFYCPHGEVDCSFQQSVKRSFTEVAFSLETVIA